MCAFCFLLTSASYTSSSGLVFSQPTAANWKDKDIREDEKHTESTEGTLETCKDDDGNGGLKKKKKRRPFCSHLNL